MDGFLADTVEAMRDEAALARGQGSEQEAVDTEAEADRYEAMISEEYLAHFSHPSEDRVRALERSTLTRDVRDGPDYADELLDTGGFTRTAEDNPQVHDYARLEAEADEALGMAATAHDKADGMTQMELKHDLWVFQYCDPSKPLDHEEGRSHEFWTPVDPADIPRLPEEGRLARAEDGNALLPSWGDRTHVMVALIPAGTVINVGETRPQAERKELTEKLRWATDTSGSLRSEFEQGHILENTLPYVRIGGGDEIRFDRFDDGWIKGRAPIRPDPPRTHQ
jgi:hypothetical protein